MPPSIVKRAEDILHKLEEAGASAGSAVKKADIVKKEDEGVQLSFFKLDDPILEQIRDEIINLDVNNLTPLEALNKLNEIKRILNG